MSAVRIVGGLLPNAVLTTVLAEKLKGSDFHLGSENPRDAAARAWSHLTGAYASFRKELGETNDAATSITRERWLGVLLTDLGYGRVPLTGPGGIEADGKQFAVSHLWGSVPMHLLGWNVPLDTRTRGLAGAAQRAPHALVQELLNRSEPHLWAIVSNGRVLRLLRDSTSLVGQAYVEFDLEAIFDGDLYSDFVQLYLLCHESRLEPLTPGQPATCPIEVWRTTAISSGVRALNQQRDGVERALETLGTGFLQHPANAALLGRMQAGELSLKDIHTSLLRIVYRLLFWSVAEERNALHPLDAAPEVTARYRAFFSAKRLRETSLRRFGSTHDDLWQGVGVVMRALGQGDERLGLPGLGGLFQDTETDVLTSARLGNQDLLKAVKALAVVQPRGEPMRRVDFGQLGAEELGSIYESLLELVPRHDPAEQRFFYETLAGNDRKTTGSYYTPTALVELVLDTALDPVLDAAEKAATDPNDAERRLLALKVCDPAIGSGHFMVAAARRIAMRVAAVRTQEVDPTPTAVQDAMHDVVGRCIYGVDLNPMAADLAKVSLWLEAMTPGKPLSFLDHHIKVGNALLGTTPALIAAGIPDGAYKPLTGDDKKVAASWRKTNKAERDGQLALHGEDLHTTTVDLQAAARALTDAAAGARTLEETARAAHRYASDRLSPEAVRARRVADAWCAAFLGPKTADGVEITTGTVRFLDGSDVNPDSPRARAVGELATRYRFFHWHLEFLDVFSVSPIPSGTGPGWSGGFDAVLGNPPWERVKLQEQEFFAARDADIANAANAAARRKAIAALETEHPELSAEFNAAKRDAEGESQFLRLSGRYPLCGVGDVNTYSVFAEHFRTVLAITGRSGIITPTGLATDATTAAFFADTVRLKSLVAVYDFVTNPEIWGEIGHGRQHFIVFCCTGGETVPVIDFAFDARHPRELTSATSKLSMTSADIARVNPNTLTCPVFSSSVDARITIAVYERFPILIRDGEVRPNAWGLRFGRMFDMANDSTKFQSAAPVGFDGWTYAEMLPLYEAKLLNHWNNRFSGYANVPEGYEGTALPRLSAETLNDPDAEPLARYWVDEVEVRRAVPSGWDREWLFGWRDIARASDVRTFTPSVLPLAAVGHKFPLAFPTEPRLVPLLQSVWSSLVFDYISRQKLSGTGMTYFIVKQLACPPPAAFDDTPVWTDKSLAAFVRPRVLELTYTSHRIRPYAVDVCEGDDPGAPFHWLPGRRDQIRAELDAAMLHLYGLDRADAEHVLDSFFVLAKYEQRDHGEFRTKRLVLAAYDAMAAAAAASPFVSPLDPPSGEGPRHAARDLPRAISGAGGA